MADTDDMNLIRVGVLGRSVDESTTWTTTGPAGNRNALDASITERVVTRLLNNFSTAVAGAVETASGVSTRFADVVGDVLNVDKAEFDALGMNLIQAVSALVAGGGIVPGALSLEFVFPDPVTTNDFVELTVAQDCTIAANLAGAEYTGTAVADELLFDLTVEPSGDLLGDISVLPGDNQATFTGIGGEIAAGTVLRMTVDVSGGGNVSPGAVIKIAAERKAAPVTAGRFEHPQNVADTEWIVTHNLNARLVAVQVVNTAGTTVIGDIDFETANRCVLHFTSPVAGTAIIRR